ncbi:HAD family hydrolase [Roseospira visakhapatnamensis]|uniref:Putative hydrolase of the HAD superfamily n=1 Tax=Roseospira visakhapatnamensis TaxID=390880 RepID=A0A7W6W8N3_9PROT|nr:HAD family hydrolase [Roseospira visakhapatnamensis]MBB4264591.1 putative hydrolase of the HAD superfamily [Roseospira visakhapatnamensis]
MTTSGQMVIGIDGDDTLWHMEKFYADAQRAYGALLKAYGSSEEIDARLLRTETRNIDVFGYGVKSFVLSMIETALEVSDREISGRDVETIMRIGHDILQSPTELIDGVADVIQSLSASHRLILITKGELISQERRIAESGLAASFEAIEIVSEKTPATYRTILKRHGVPVGAFVMIGNSVRSDIAPVLDIGGRAVHIPYHVTWAHEAHAPLASDSADTTATAGLWRLDSIREVPDLLARIGRAGTNDAPRG